MRRALAFVAVVSLSFNALAAEPKVLESECGGARFRVEMRNAGHPLANSYQLLAITSQGARKLYEAEAGGWFHAACTFSRDGKQILVFQSYCGGSACVEDKYGAVSPESLKLVLVPSTKNVSNSKKLGTLLGRPPPHLPNDKTRFCCE